MQDAAVNREPYLVGERKTLGDLIPRFFYGEERRVTGPFLTGEGEIRIARPFSSSTPELVEGEAAFLGMKHARHVVGERLVAGEGQ
jgi:hypothetical protein